MQRRGWLFVLCLMAIGQSAAAVRVFAPVPAEGQEIRFQDGETVLVTRNARAGLTIAFVPRDKKSAWVKVGIQNLGTEPFNVSDTSVTATSGGGPLVVMTYADRLKEEGRRERWAAVAAGFAAASNNINAANAGYQHTYGTYSGTTNASVYGNGGSAYGTAYTSGSYYGTTYNAAAAQQAQANANSQNRAIMEQQRANAEFARRDLKDRALKANTLMPDQFVLGDVRFDLPKKNKDVPVELSITVDLAGDPITVLYREQL